MYQVFIDDYLIYDKSHEYLRIINPILNLEINKVGLFDFAIYPTHPYFNVTEKLKSQVIVRRGNKDIFRGRIIKDGQKLYNDKYLNCESALSYLNDSVFRPFKFNGSPAELFTLIIEEHNSQVDEMRQFRIGTVTVTDPNNLIIRSSQDYLNCFEVLKTRLFESALGGYIVERYEDEDVEIIDEETSQTKIIKKKINYLDYLEDFDDTSTQEIEFGKNLIDIVTSNDASTTYSVVVPLGAQLEEIIDEETGEIIQEARRVTIASVNDGKDYLVNEIALSEYGWIVAPSSETTWDDVTQPENLLRKAQDVLDNIGIMMQSSIQLSAIDLNVVDRNIESFFIREYVRLYSIVHNIDKVYLLSKISIPLDTPEGTKITLGETISSFSGIQMGNKQRTDELINRVGQVEADYVKNQDLTTMRNETLTETTRMIQSSEEILLAAMQDYVLTGDFDEYRQSVMTQLNVLADQIIAKFEITTTSIEELDGETRQQFEHLHSYIRGYMNEFGQPVLELGSNQSEVVVQVNNEGFQIKKIYNSNHSEVISEFTLLGLTTNNVYLSGKFILQDEVTDVITSNGHRVYITYIREVHNGV